jgi:hypothetical protein
MHERNCSKGFERKKALKRLYTHFKYPSFSFLLCPAKKTTPLFKKSPPSFVL